MSSVSRRTFVAASGAGAAAAVALPPMAAAPAEGPHRRSILQTKFPVSGLANALLSREQWKPYPAAATRGPWDALDVGLRNALLEAGEEALKGQWAMLPATLFLQYVRTGNRANYERVNISRRNRLRDLVMAECVEGKGRFTDEIANGVWLICEETWWGYPAHLNGQKSGHGLPEITEPVVDLFAAETAGLLAWTSYLVGPALDKVHVKVRERAALEMNRRVFEPYLAREDWSWMGLKSEAPVNNWNPWINSNVLSCALLLEPSEKRRVDLVAKVIRSTDRFLDSYHDDGGCDEGPSYWGKAGASLFDVLDLLNSGSGGKLNAFDNPLVKEIGRYIYRVQIADDWFVNFADASAKLTPAASLIFRFGRLTGDADMQAFAADVFKRHGNPHGESLLRLLPSVFGVEELKKAPGRQPLVADAWLPGIQILTAREKAGSATGLYLAAQGGHNAESHNHNDVGNFIVFANGKPALIDAGVETYTAKTFSSKRYDIWTMQSAYHNCPTINGVMQSPGRDFAASNVAYKASPEATEFGLDLQKAYPPAAGINTWRRTIRLNRRAKAVELVDAFALKAAGGSIDFTLMTPCEVKVSGQEIRLGDVAIVKAEGAAFEVAVEPVKIEDSRLKGSWGTQIFRVLVKLRNVPASGEFRMTVRAV